MLRVFADYLPRMLRSIFDSKEITTDGGPYRLVNRIDRRMLVQR